MQGRPPGYFEIFHQYPIFLYALSDLSVFVKQTDDADFMLLSSCSDHPFKDPFSASLVKLSNSK
jgi:hypothetical protein